LEAILNYFETIPSAHRSLILVGGLTIFWLLEGATPLFKFNYKKWQHAVPNFFLTFTTVLINFLAHFVEHKVKPLWMVHLVHHTDHNVDTTTANRHHPIESVIRFGFTLAGVFIIGVPIGMVMLFQSISLVLSQFNHANIKLPKKLDDALSWIIVSPDMHKVHHHNVLPYTDSNYGNIFSIWDRLFGTFMKLDPEKIVYGVDVFPNEEENRDIKNLLTQPFQKYKKPTIIPVNED